MNIFNGKLFRSQKIETRRYFQLTTFPRSSLKRERKRGREREVNKDREREGGRKIERGKLDKEEIKRERWREKGR